MEDAEYVTESENNLARVNKNIAKEYLPKKCIFILINIFGHQYGIMAIRCMYFRYLRMEANYEEKFSRLIIHSSIALAYFMTTPGALLAAKFSPLRAIWFVIFIFIGGYLLMAVSTFFIQEFRILAIISLYAVCIGFGSLKMAIQTLAKNQLTVYSEHRYITSFYIVTIMSGLFSTISNPLLASIPCFGNEKCYPLSFGLSFILAFIGTVSLLSGSQYYFKGNGPLKSMVMFYHCSIRSLYKKIMAGNEEEMEYWLNYGYEIYDNEFVEKVKDFYSVAAVLIPLPIFWALFDQQITLFLLQAEVMDNRLLGFNLYPEMIFILIPLCSSALFPVFLYGVFPLMDKIKLFRCVLDRITLGFLLAVISYAVATFLEAYLENSRLKNPGSELGQIALVNGCNCNVTVFINSNVDYIKRTIKPLDKLIVNNLESTGVHFFDSVSDVACQNISYSNFYDFKIIESKSLTYLLVLEKEDAKYLGPYEDVQSKDFKSAVLRILYHFNNLNYITLQIKGPQEKEFLLNAKDSVVEDMLIRPGNYNISLNKQVKLKNVLIDIGGIYTILIVEDINSKVEIKIFAFVEPNSVHIFWLIPQMLLVLFAEMFVSNNCIAYFFHKTANDMRIVVMSFWLATCSLGNLIVTLDASLPFSTMRYLYTFLQYTCLMILDTAGYIFISAYLKAEP